MAKFPEYTSVAPVNPIRPRIRFKTLRSKFGTEGTPNRKQQWLYPKRDIVLQYNYITKTDAETLWEFYLARKGSYEAFNYFMPEPKSTYPDYTGEYVGIGDGSATVFNMPSKVATSVTIYIDGIEYSQAGNPADVTFTSEGGIDGADKIEFNSAPSSGAKITADFSGTLKLRVTFKEDYFDYEVFYDRLVNIGLELKGELNK